MKWLWLWLVGLFSAAPLAVPSPSPAAIYEPAGNYRYSHWLVDDFSRLQLGSNLDTRQAASAIKETLNCEFLTNAGFYDTADRHLGWFQADGREISPTRVNRFFDGFLLVKNSQAAIVFQADPAAWLGVQSGPILIYDGKPLRLSIKDDQPRRRIVAAINSQGQLIFYVLLSGQSDYAGPLLAETPQLLLQINPQIVSALNLDGGSASAFLSEAVFLPEYQTIGGYFCYTKL